MEGSGTLGNSQASYSITTSDSSTVKIKALFYFGREPEFSESDGKLRIAKGCRPHLVRLRNDISYEQFKKIICSLSPVCRDFSYYDDISYYLPGHDLIALKTEEDMKNMIEEFDELNRIQEPQMLKIQQENGARSNDSNSTSGASHSSSRKIKVVCCTRGKFLAFGSGKFWFWRDETHLVYLRDDISFEDVKMQMEALSGKPAYKIRYAGFRMEGSSTLGNIQGIYSTTASDSTTVKIKTLVYDDNAPSISVIDGKLQITRAFPQAADSPHLIHCRNDTSFKDFKQIVRSRCGISLYNCVYYLPGQDLIALSSEEDMKCMIEEFVELSRIQGPQIFKVFNRL